jgi:predicted dehydrogenase
MDKKPTQASPGQSTRRDFIKTTAAVAAAAAAAPLFKTPVYGQSQAPAAGSVVGANSRITVGFIGVGSQGMNAHVNLLTSKAAENNIAEAAVCDVWPKRTAAAKDFTEKAISGAKVEVFSDYRKLLERKDIDAVVIATHDPIHAPAAIAALEAGKHVYCEKPMTRYLEEAFAVQDAVKKSGKIMQIGSQYCSDAAWHKAAELIRAGKIGELVWAQGSYCRNSVGGEWNFPIDADAKADTVDWEKWLGQVHKRVPFNADHYFRWRKYYPYCAGLLGDLMPHRLHPLLLASGKPEFPVRVVCVGTKNVHADKNTPGTPERDVPEHIQMVAEFPGGYSLQFVCSSVNARSPGAMIYGHKATLAIDDSGSRIQITPETPYAEEIDPDTLDGLKPSGGDISTHHKNWLDCIRANKQPNCGVDLAVRVQTVVSLAEMSERLKVACLFDEATRKITTGDGKEIKPITYGALELS